MLLWICSKLKTVLVTYISPLQETVIKELRSDHCCLEGLLYDDVKSQGVRRQQTFYIKFVARTIRYENKLYKFNQ